MSFSVEGAKKIAVQFLKRKGPSSSEDITNYCKKRGQLPDDDRAFGAVYSGLHREKLTHRVDTCLRRKGHNTTGGNVWGLV